MIRPRFVVIGVWLLAACFRASVLEAQPPVVEISGGYAALFDSQLPKTTPVAWTAAVAWPLNDRLDLAGEASGQDTRTFYNTSDYYTFTEPCDGIPNIPIGVPCPPGGTVQVTRGRRGDQEVKVQTFVVGLCFVQRSWRLRPFVHALLGVAHVTWDVTLEDLPADAVPVPSPPGAPNGSGTSVPETTRGNSTAVQVGAGFDIPLWERLSARFAADSRRLLGEPRFKSQFRLSAHLVLALSG